MNLAFYAESWINHQFEIHEVEVDDCKNIAKG